MALAVKFLLELRLASLLRVELSQQDTGDVRCHADNVRPTFLPHCEAPVQHTTAPA